MSAAASSSSSHPQPPRSQQQMIHKFIDALRQQGFLDNDFNNRRTAPGHLDSLVTFCVESEPKLEIIQKALEGEHVDFRTAINTSEMIRSAATRVGGSRVASACIALQEHLNNNNLNGSKEAYKKLSWEYYVIRDSFHHILQAEKTVEV
ncbi:hypothetical protein IC582_028539 [Cucumis melo]|uniref:Histidine-containing phosphotransfer protein n=2 Tax=Cucumis melo TaxID=3656 RepID=A0A5D3CFG6_CUCMM|nr:histidine-containing phosphotransfer protein 5-like [Cucumis melo]KAA0040904.1 histidine-containing phosphotransfer protein 5-like [Cucumis melo var. makuwa]TYK10633.1 histidine-containing phosphotransfer protein 5-like [Cucumis melo var. makuwa]